MPSRAVESPVPWWIARVLCQAVQPRRSRWAWSAARCTSPSKSRKGRREPRVRREIQAIPEAHPGRPVQLARKVPWGHRGRWVRKARPVIRVVHQGRKVLLDHKEQMVPRDLKAPPVQKGRKVQLVLKVIRADLQARKEWTVPQDPQAHRVRWEKSALWI